MVGSFAEFERAMIRERTSAGLAAARAESHVICQSGNIRNAITDRSNDCPAWSRS
ncbi:MAG: recombinase family protein [Acidiphilium sp.]|nr:recombinase family protein [Acidiphilium sp.]MDD4936672.1 recombinase family protein [Acidiphilium sp.]